MVAPNTPPSDPAAASPAASAPPSPSSTGDKPPVSVAKLAANQANAQKSTGPRTEAGRAASRLNAVKHGLRAEIVVLPGEDPREFADFVDSTLRELRPKGALQAGMAREVAVYTRRLRRVPAAERMLFKDHDPAPHDYAHSVVNDFKDFTDLIALDRKTLNDKELERLGEITERMVQADRRRYVRARNAADGSYLDDDPIHAAEIVAAMIRSRGACDGSPNSLLWVCQRYESHILRARSAVLRELLKLQKVHGVAPEGEET